MLTKKTTATNLVTQYLSRDSGGIKLQEGELLLCALENEEHLVPDA